jgi:hypothetical protein
MPRAAKAIFPRRSAFSSSTITAGRGRLDFVGRDTI